MERFFLSHKIGILKQQLAIETDARSRRSIEAELRATERELALDDAALRGIPLHNNPRPFRLQLARRDIRLTARFQAEVEGSAEPYLIIDPRPGLHIVDMNDAYTALTMVDRDRVAGERVYDVFPDNPDDPFADGVKNTYASLEIAASTLRTDAMQVQRYDVRDPTGQFVERFWHIVSTAIRNTNGQLMYLLVQLEDVTAEVKAS